MIFDKVPRPFKEESISLQQMLLEKQDNDM